MEREAKMLRIGQFARLARVSVKTLRHYDAFDLLKPASVDTYSGYRYYSPRQLERLHRILDLKSMGLALETVRDILNEALGAAELHETLLARRRELSESIASQREQLADVEARLAALAEGRARARAEVLLRTTKPRRVAFLRSDLSSYEEADALFVDLERRLDPPDRLGALGAIWHRCANDGAIDCEAFVPVSDSLRLPRGLSAKELPEARMATVLHFGADEEHESTYRAARRWIADRGRKVSGPNHEIYLSRSDNDRDDDDITEVQFPLEGS